MSLHLFHRLVGQGYSGTGIEQEGFRVYKDDADPSTSTALAAQDANIAIDKGISFFPRWLMNATGDNGTVTFRMDYRRDDEGDDEFRVV
jgi:hypothetical protein